MARLVAVVAVAVGLAAAVSCASAHSSDKCQAPFPVGDSCTADIDQIRATQFVVGDLEIACKVGHYEALDAAGKLDDYLSKNHVPAYGAPDGNLYIVDHHHQCRALLDANIKSSAKKPVIDVKDDYSSLPSMDAFWVRMLAGQNLWLYGSDGKGPLSPSLLPTDLSRMANDPYRSLAWLVRSAGGYAKLDVPFQDFAFAQVFRQSNLVPVPVP
eukprot:CAMPEP_0203820910 /NCGR_PEP_ID=MMETSP0115-20131106/41503_1 /ASSEMBLY_ACC=CAM_ASM_000227 /TAXON_ID=33651 /ORGANISM="Bicosoecid sp, Strain ms1" /LENGTH=212 /DNA_ID=CAMNT_0050729929 /DNA_START=63 /DNA_END=697 /DNA_ORIENTATION=+